MRFWVGCSVFFLAANILIYRAVLAPRTLGVTALEVGKGDATLVRTPSGRTILIDTGPDASILRALGMALAPWQKKIDAVILTSTKKNSVGGLPDVLSRYKIAQQITITGSKRLSFEEGSYVDILISPEGTKVVVPN